ncbi:MAG: class B sortase [Eubacteriales bacterium]
MTNIVKNDATGGFDGSDTEFVENPAQNSEADPFLHSLDTLTPDDIAPAVPKKKKSPSDIAFSAVRIVLLCACAGVFAYSAASIVKSLVAYRQSEQLYGELSDEFFSDGDSFLGDTLVYDEDADYPSSPSVLRDEETPRFDNNAVSDQKLSDAISDVEVSDYNKQFETMKSKLNALTIKNPDTYGYITVDGTQISYPVMQSEDNDYYLDHAYTGTALPAGSIFADFRNYRSLLKNFNLILYGHNMKNGLMFNGLTSYLDEDFFYGDHPITVYTLDGIFTYEIFAIYETAYDYDYIRTSFKNYDEFIKYCTSIEQNSIFRRDDISFAEGDRILTLSTCTNGAWNKRYAVHAKLVSIER